MHFLQQILLSISLKVPPVFFTFESIVITFSPTLLIISPWFFASSFITSKFSLAPNTFLWMESNIKPCSSTSLFKSKAISLSAFFLSTPLSFPCIKSSWEAAWRASSFFLLKLFLIISKSFLCSCTLSNNCLWPDNSSSSSSKSSLIWSNSWSVFEIISSISFISLSFWDTSSVGLKLSTLFLNFSIWIFSFFKLACDIVAFN